MRTAEKPHRLVGPARYLLVAAVLALGWSAIAAAQTITEYPVPTTGSNPFGIIAGPDGALWFTESSGNRIGRITTAGAITEYPIPTANSGPVGITAGPDGALWFTEFAGKIGRITTGGVITEFPISTANSDPTGITVGPDGALWFLEDAGKVGRITIAGAITEYPTPTATGIYFGMITTGPDGALWFTEFNANQIARISTGGAITEYPLPTSNTGPTGITVGPDGALWFAEGGGNGNSGNKIGQITTAGAITLFPIPNTGTALQPYGITAGPDEALWFTEFSGNQIGQITTGGTIATGYPVPTASSAPAGITAGPGGALWFTELNANKIGTVLADTLSVSLAGAGSGQVTSNPAGINCGPTSNQCAAPFIVGTQVTLAATATNGSTFDGWVGSGCSGVSSCTVTIAPNTSLTASFIPSTTTNIALYAAVLPLSRSVEVGATATAFATILNAGPGDASTCSITPATSTPASFVFQTTDPTTNALTGTPNTPVNIAQGAGQSFVIAFTPSAAFAPTNVLLTFGCANASPAPQIVGIDTLNLSASGSAVPDVVALAASSDPGYLDIPGSTGTSDFAVATDNLGAAAQITFAANTGTANLPLTLLVCQTNPQSGACLAAPAANVTTTIAASATPTFAVFATGSASIPDAPGVNRVFATFTDANGVLRGETSVAVRTQ